jgi:hypothetical protein
LQARRGLSHTITSFIGNISQGILYILISNFSLNEIYSSFGEQITENI